MKLNLHLKYWALPLMVLIILMGMYFSGIRWAQELICPSVNWELGIVENMQLALLLMMFLISIIGIKRKKHKIEKLVFIFLSIFTLFVFLEEIDYGAHFRAYFTNDSHTLFNDLTGRTNLHNVGNNAKLFKRSIYPFMGIFFLTAPLFINRIKSPILRYLIPNKWIITTAILTIFSYLIPRILVDFNIFEDGGFGVNIGEFSEIMVYYIFFLYLHEIIYKKEFVKKVNQ